MAAKRNPNSGIITRHSRRCAISTGGKRCTGSPICVPSYLATVATGRRGHRIRQTFHTLAAAKAWQADQRRHLYDGADLSSAVTVSDALKEFQDGLDNGRSRAKGKVAYKPSVANSYKGNIARLSRCLGGRLVETRLRDLSPQLVQRVVDELVAEGLSPSTVRNTIIPLRKVVATARKDRTIMLDPFVDLDLPTAAERPLRVASAEEAGRLLDALDYPDRTYFACAFYAGLRRGEISALRWSDIDAPDIHVRRSYCHTSHTFTEPKSRHGRRVVPAAAQLFPILKEYRAELDDPQPGDLVFPSTGGSYRGREGRGAALLGSVVKARAWKAWEANSLDRISLQEARHTYASIMAAGGVDMYRLSAYMGHGSIEITIKRYTHLYDEQRVLDSKAITAAVERSDSRSRIDRMMR
jgi:integrase